MWIVELEPGVWIADGEGDPPRTLRCENARRFLSYRDAERALRDALRLRSCSFEQAEIINKTEPPDDTPIPACLYSCSSDSCAEERTWPASDLHWVPAWGGWYCDLCIDDLHEDEDVEIGISLAAWLKCRHQAEIERLTKLVHEIDATLRVPAAEYVPAIGDVFELIDRGGMRADAEGGCDE